MTRRETASLVLYALGAFGILGGIAYMAWIEIGPPCDGFLCGIGQLIMAIFVMTAGGLVIGLGLAVAPRDRSSVWLLLFVAAVDVWGLVVAAGMLGMMGRWADKLIALPVAAAALAGLVAAFLDARAKWRRRLRHA